MDQSSNLPDANPAEANCASRAPDLASRREELLEHQERLLPDPSQVAAFRNHMTEPPAASARLNPLIPLSDEVRRRAVSEWEAVPWCPDAFVVPGSQVLGKSLEFALGCFYIQAKATTLAVEALAPQPGERVLDLAAAPGGKASHIAARMGNSGLLVVNEPRARRFSPLVGNLDRCGVHNAIFTKTTGTMLARHFHNFFDRVLLDAPCSGDGILCKDDSMLSYWSVADAINKSREQLGLLRAAFHMLRPGGRLVYSTCSLSTEENEDVLLALLRTHRELVELQIVDGIELTRLPGAVAASYPTEFDRVARIWPHLHQTEGAFVACIHKTGATTWHELSDDVSAAIEETASEAAPSIGGHRADIEERWGFEMPLAADQELAVEGRHLHLRPRDSASVRSLLPYYVRAGMRVAGIHKGHLHLTHQAIRLWGGSFIRKRVEVTWPQVQCFFKGQQVCLDAPVDCKGEALFCFGPWPVCRGLVGADGLTLEGFVPKSLRTDDISTLFDYASS
jgi:NOL1/NOP2/sun family putative RNA methylase